MRVMVVHSHPGQGSFSHAARDRAVAALEGSGHEVDLWALDEIGFAASMSTEERRAYHDQGANRLDPLVDRAAEGVLAAEALLFVYPTWWFGPPARLKGFLDRVMLPGVSFGFDDAGRVVGRLRHLRRIGGISTYGASRLGVTLVGDQGRRLVNRNLRMSCGWRTRTTWLGLYGIESTTADQRDAFLDRVEQRIGRW